MTGRTFVDTNVLIYARDQKEGDKRQRAQAWLDRLSAGRNLVTNLQVLNEFARWLLRNERSRSLESLRREIDLLAYYGAEPLTAADVERAWEVREKLGYQWFDCLLIAAATAAQCHYFLSEDMTHEARYGGLTVINPFRVDPDAFLKKN
jgi:predicted nucleic acid-binding protein